MRIFIRILAKIYTAVYTKVSVFRHRLYIRYLITDGLLIGKNVTIAKSAIIDTRYPYLVSIGNNCTISDGCIVLAHDAAAFKFTDHTRIGKVEIRDNCYFGMNVIITPGVTIGPNVVVAAGSVVNKDIPPNSCVTGVPARFYAKFDEMIARHESQIAVRSVFTYEELSKGLNDEIRNLVRESVKDGFAYSKGFPGRYPYDADG
ncbi:MAG: acyltransferase [Planctomycetes bacterium]|nr:acyltransferase [Planctomycetota bacterium]